MGCYADDLLHCTSTEVEAIKTVSDSRAICTKGHLHLHKFTSNSKSVMKSIPNTERQEAKSQELYIDDDNLEREYLDYNGVQRPTLSITN